MRVAESKISWHQINLSICWGLNPKTLEVMKLVVELENEEPRPLGGS